MWQQLRSQFLAGGVTMAGYGLPISKAHVQGGKWPVAALMHGIT